MADKLKTTSLIDMNMLLVLFGYSCYKAVAYNSYVTNFTVTDSAYGYISDLPFMFGASVGIIGAALVIFTLSRRKIIGPFGLCYKIPLVILALCYGLGYVATPFFGGGFDHALALPLLGFIWGAVTVTLTIVWIELFTYVQSALVLIVQLACASFVSAVLALLISYLPQEFNTVVGMLLALVCIPILAVCRRRFSQSSVPAKTNETLKENAEAPTIRGKKGSLSAALTLASTPLLAYFFFELVVGLINMFAYEGTSSFSISTNAPIQGMLICSIAVVLFVLATSKAPSPNTIYLAVFPIIISVFLVLPLFGERLAIPLSSIIYAAYVFTSSITVFCYVEATRKTQADPYQVAALVGAGVRVMLMIGIGLGYLISNRVEAETYMQLSIVVVVCVYFLGIVIVLWAYRNSKSRKSAGEQPVVVYAESYEDLVLSRVEDLTQTHCLTNRERDVLLGLSKGNSAARIAEDLFISTSTVQGYIKTLYVKLGVNKNSKSSTSFLSEHF